MRNSLDAPFPKSAVPLQPWPILWSSLQIGGLSGMTGVLVGGVAGVLKSTSPTLFAIAAGIQWFTLGSTFWATREIILHEREKDYASPKNGILTSGIAGGVAGCLGGFLRGRKNIVPGAIMFALFGGAGQVLYNLADARHVAHSSSKYDTKAVWLSSEWSPVKVLSDDEYERMLHEKLLRVKVEIALLDESITSLKSQEGQALATDQALK